MPKILFVLLILPVFLFSQSYKTYPQTHEFDVIFDDVVGQNGDQDTTDNFDLYWWAGNAVLAIVWDSLSTGDQSDSCLTISIEYYSDEFGWGNYSDGSTSTTLLDSINRGYENSGVIYINLQDYDNFIWNEEARLIIGIGTADSSNLKIGIGGQ